MAAQSGRLYSFVMPTPDIVLPDVPVPDPSPDEKAVALEPAPVAEAEEKLEAPVVEERWSRHQWQANVLWAAGVTATLTVVLCGLRFLPSVAWPLLLAAGFAYLCDPVVSALARRGLSRTWATSALLATGALVGLAGLLALVPLLLAQARSVPGYLRSAFDIAAPRIESLTGVELPDSLRELAHLGQSHIQELVTQVLPGAGSAFGKIVGGSLSVASFLVAALIVPVVGFFLLRSWPRTVERAQSLVPPRFRDTVTDRMHAVDRMLGGYIRGQFTLSSVLSVLYAVALSAIGLKLALVVALVTGFGNLVPYVGTSIGVALAVGFTLVDFGFDHHLLLVVGTYVVLGVAEGVFISPRIVGDRVGLSPASVIVAVMACGALFGFAGVLLAVPVAAVLKLVLSVGEQAWRQSDAFDVEEPPAPPEPTPPDPGPQPG